METPNALSELARKIRDWQESHSLSDTEFCKRFGGLGSTKTYKRILAGDLDELDPGRWEDEYQQAWNLIQLASESNRPDEPAYPELAHMKRLRFAVTDAMAETGNNRLVILEGPSGSGKTTAARAIAEKYGRAVVLAEADETWKESPNATLGGLLRAIGIKEVPPSADARKTKLLEKLKDSPVCLVIDEAHHLGPRTLNLVKTIITQTKCQVVFLCIETLFKKLECAAYEEAKQLTKNRLCERVRLDSPGSVDIQFFLQNRLTFEPADLKPCADLLATRSAQCGNWNFVNLVARHCRKLAGKAPADKEVFAEALKKAANSR